MATDSSRNGRRELCCGEPMRSVACRPGRYAQKPQCFDNINTYSSIYDWRLAK
jgi:hypothetical protein